MAICIVNIIRPYMMIQLDQLVKQGEIKILSEDRGLVLERQLIGSNTQTIMIDNLKGKYLLEISFENELIRKKINL